MRNIDKNFNAMFTANYKTDQGSYLIQIKAKASNTNDLIRNNHKINAIVSQALSYDQRKPNENILISFEKDKIYFYHNSKKILFQDGKQVPESVQTRSLKITQLGNQLLSKRSLTFKEVMSTLVQSWPSRVPIVNLFWSLAVYPLTLIAKALYPGKIFDLSTLKLKNDPFNEKSLQNAMEEVVDILQIQSDEASKQVVDSFTAGTHLSKVWNGHDHQAKLNGVKNLSEQLTSSITKKDVVKSLAVIPGGYWKNEHAFQPCLWSFYRDDKGNLCLSDLSYGKEESTHARIYSFGKNPDKTKIEKVLFNLMALTTHPLKAKELEKNTIIGLGFTLYLKKLFPQERENKSEKSTQFTLPMHIINPLSFERFKEGICVEGGGTPLVIEGEKAIGTRLILKEDPIKLIHETIKNQFPSASLKDKAIFSLHLLNNRLNKVIAAFPQMMEEEKIKWLDRLEKDYKSLERQVDKAGYGINLTSTFESFERHINQLKKHLDYADINKLHAQQKLKSKLNVVSPGKFNITINQQGIKSLEESPVVGVERISQTELEQLRLLESQIQNKDSKAISEINKILVGLTNRVNELVEKKQFETAIELYHGIMALIPTPSDVSDNVEPKSNSSIPLRMTRKNQPVSNKTQIAHHQIPETGFWKILLEGIGNEKNDISLRSNQIKELSEQLGKLSHYFWESKLKTLNLPMKPDEWVYMLNTEAAMHQLVEIRLKVISKYQNNDDLTKEEKFLKAAAPYNQLSNYYSPLLSSKPLNEKHLRFGENPNLAKKFDKVVNYLKFIRSQDEIDVNWLGMRMTSDQNKQEIEKKQCVAILELQNGKRPSSREVDDFWLKYYSKSDANTNVFVPEQITNIGKHQLMYTSLLFPETGIGHEAITLKGAGIAVGGLIKRITGKMPDLENEQHKRFLNAMAEIQSFDRLDLIPSQTLGIPRYGVVKKGTKPGSSISINISSNGLSELQRLGIGHHKDVHKGFINNPGKIFGESLGIYNSEHDKIVNALKSDSVTPIDDYLLSAIQYSSTDEHFNTHEVFDLILQRPWLLNYLDKNLKGKEGLEGHKRFYEVLFSPSNIVRSLKNNPEYFLSHGPILQEMLERLLKEKKTVNFSFLLYLTDTVYKHCEGLIKEFEANNNGVAKDELVKAMSKWPQKQSVDQIVNQTFLNQAFNLWKNEKDIQNRLDIGGYFINMFANQIETEKSEDNPLLQDPTTIAKLFQICGLLELAPFGATIPIVAIQGKSWFKEKIVHNIEKMEIIERNDIIDAIIKEQFSDFTISEGNWIPHKNQPMIWQKKDTIIDLASMQILSYKGKDVSGIEVPLPPEVILNSDYQQIFGDKTFKAFLRLGKSPDEFIYSFKNQADEEFRIILNKSSRSIVLEKKFNSKGKNKKEWRRFIHPEMPLDEPPLAPQKGLMGFILKKVPQLDITKQITNEKKQGEGIEKQLLKAGIWVDPSNPKQGISYLGQGDRVSKMAFNLSFDKLGTLKSIKAEEDLEVIHDPEENLKEILGCLPSDQIIFLRKNGYKHVSEIRLLDQNISLIRSSKKHPWKIKSDDDLDGAEWVMGTEKGATTNALLKSLGFSIEQSGFAVRKDDATHLLLWPHKVSSKSSYKSENIKFDQLYHLDPPLKIKINDEGEVTSSTGGYLELAYQFAIKHDYGNVSYYLDKARTAKVRTKEELSLITIIESHFKEIPVTSARSAVVRLKSLLAIRQIFQEQTTRMQFQNENWKEFLSTTQEIQEAFQLYKTLLERTPFEQKAKYFKRNDIEISFNGDELEELEHITNESMAFLLSDATRLNSLKPEEMKLTLAPPTSYEIGMVTPLLISKMAKPVKEPVKLLENLNSSSPVIIEHFFELYNLILTKRIPPNELIPLFGPLDNLPKFSMDALQTDLSSMDPFKINLITLDIARRILLTLAAENQVEEVDPVKEPKIPLDLERLREMNRLLPQTPLSILFKISVLGVRDWYLKKDPNKTEKLQKLPEAKFVRDLQKFSIGLASFVPEGHVLGVYGFTKPVHEVSKEVINIFKQGRSVDLKKLKSALTNDKNLFGATITPILSKLLNEMNFNTQLEKMNGIIPVDKLIELVQEKTDINLLVYLRENEVKKRIHNIEEHLAHKVSSKESPQLDSQVKFNKNHFKQPINDSFSRLWKRVSSTEQLDHVNAAESDFNHVFNTKKNDLIEETNSRRLVGGIQEAAQNLKDTILQKATIEPSELKNLNEFLNINKKEIKESVHFHKKELLDYVKNNPNNFSTEIRKALKHIDKYGEQGILHLLKQSYQKLELTDPKASTLLTNLLLEQTALKVLSGEVQRQIKILEDLSKKGIGSENKEWVSAATIVKNLTTKTLTFERYLNSNGYLLDPRLMRKVIVMEAQQGFIITSEQIQLIKKMVENPTDFNELKVGLGKTSVVFPIVLMLLVEAGEFPIALVKEELLQQNLDSLDISTRDLLEKSGFEFSFSVKDSISPLKLQEQYLRFLEVEKRGGYPITSISSVIAVDQKLQLLQSELNEKTDKFIEKVSAKEKIKALLSGDLKAITNTEFGIEELKPHLEDLLKIEELQKNIYYLSKIKEKLDLILIDEADDILNPIRENNVSQGDPKPFNSSIFESMEHIMRLLLDSKNPHLKKAGDAILAGQQATLETEWVKKTLMPALVGELLKDQKFARFIGDANLNHPNLIHYICHVFEEGERIPQIPKFSEEVKKKLGALKHIIQTTLPLSLMQKPGIDAAIKASDGFQVGPHVSGQEKFGTVFSDEFDLVVNHCLFYGIKLPESQDENGFTEKGLEQIKEQYPEIYRQWAKDAKGSTVIEFLNKPENFSKRLDFLRLHVFGENKIKKFTSLISFNVQDICYGRRIGGMTGTLNRDCLPRVSQNTELLIDDVEKVTAQVFLETGVLTKSTVTVMDDSQVLENMRACVQSVDYKAVINQGYYLEKGNNKNVVAKLRLDNQGKALKRIFIFVDAEGKSNIWHPHKVEPELITKEELKRFSGNEQTCFYFSPKDTRGTDFQIPPGKGACFVSARCSTEDLVQSLGRLRGAGKIHSTDFYISKSIEERIKERNPKLNSISFAHIVEDIRKQDIQQQQGKNLKRALQSLKTVVNMGTRQLLFKPQKALNSESYWTHTTPTIRLLNTGINKLISEIAMNPETGWLIEKRDINLDSDFEKTMMSSTLQTVEKTYRLELQKIEKIEKQIMILDVPILATKLLGSSKLDSEAQNWLINRHQELKNEIKEMKRKLETTMQQIKAEFEDKKNQIYPNKVPSSDSGVPGAHAQVQEVQQQQQQQMQQQQQVQQQQQQQQQMKIRGTSQRIPADPYTKKELNLLLNTLEKNDTTKKERLMRIWGDAGFSTSTNFNHIFPLMNGAKGNLSFCRILIKNNEICLITRNDYHKISSSDEFDEIYSLINPSTYNRSLVLNRKCKKESKCDLNNIELQKQIIKAKWLLGMSEFSDKETALLKEWLSDKCKDDQGKSDMSLFIDEYGTKEQVEKLVEWNILAAAEAVV